MKIYTLTLDHEERHYLIHCLQAIIDKLEAESGVIDQFPRRRLLQKLVSLQLQSVGSEARPST